MQALFLTPNVVNVWERYRLNNLTINVLLVSLFNTILLKYVLKLIDKQDIHLRHKISSECTNYLFAKKITQVIRYKPDSIYQSWFHVANVLLVP